MSLFFVFVVAFLVSLLLVPATVKISKIFKIFKPSKDALNGKPCIGGIGIFIAFLVAVLLGLCFTASLNGKAITLLSSSFIILITGFIDDIKELRPYVKIIGEMLGIGILLYFGFSTKIVFLPAWINILVTLLWILFITNAFNLLDIMDGLTAGLVIIISSALLAISFINKDIFSSIVLAGLIGAHLGFLHYNYPPARVYMGDTGSLFSGFILAAIAINISYAPMERKLALITPILAMSLPIYDTMFLIIMRLKKKKPIFIKTKDHFALRLVTMGWSIKKSIWAMYLFSIFLGLTAILLAFSSNIIASLILLMVVLIFIIMGKWIAMVKVDD